MIPRVGVQPELPNQDTRKLRKQTSTLRLYMKKPDKQRRSIASKRFKKACLLTPLTVLAACQAEAIEFSMMGTNMPAVDIHGFGSQGYAINSGNNDYLGGESSKGTYDLREYGFNASIAKGKWRIGAQVFGQKLGPYGDDKMRLDWGIVDFQATQWFGLRAGRVKMPRGLYNESIDLDSTRPFVFMPQSVYDARLRDFQASFDGGMAYGNIDLKKAGSLDYKIFGGHIPMSTSSGASDYFNTDAPFPNLDIHMDDAFGASLFWNTPLQGMRFGYSFSRFENFETLRYVPFRQANSHKVAPTYDRHLFSAEYTTGNWVFAAEGGLDDTEYFVAYDSGVKYASLYPSSYYMYASATWRPKRWLELGAYYSRSHFDQRGVGTPVVFPDLDQGDLAISTKFNFTDYIFLKLEGHYLDGSGAVFDVPSHPQPISNRENSWFMFAVKGGFSF